jgi:hypothetical protein
VFPDALLPALVQHVHNSTLPMDKLVAQFVEAQASAGVRLAKARVKGMVKEISTMRMVSKAPLYTVKPEVLLAIQQGPAAAEGHGAAHTAADTPLPAAQAAKPTAEAAAAAGEAAGRRHVDAMQVDTDHLAQQVEAGSQQQQRQQSEIVSGAKRLAGGQGSAEAVASAGAACSIVRSLAEGDKGPPCKKQKTPAGIERFFSSSSKPGCNAESGAVAAAGKLKDQQQQQQLEVHPTTPKHRKQELLVNGAAAAGTAPSAVTLALADCTAAGQSSVLPMLTPPSDLAADRPGKDHSPVPFRIDAAAPGTCSDGETGDQHAEGTSNGRNEGTAVAAGADVVDMQVEAGTSKQQLAVSNRHAPADCGGQDLQSGYAKHPAEAEQQQQQQDQAAGIAGAPLITQQEEKTGQLRLATAAVALANGPASSSTTASCQVPALPDDGSIPGSTFWKQLVSLTQKNAEGS